jgi:hypothetical protein
MRIRIWIQVIRFQFHDDNQKKSLEMLVIESNHHYSALELTFEISCYANSQARKK